MSEEKLPVTRRSRHSAEGTGTAGMNHFGTVHTEGASVARPPSFSVAAAKHS